MPSAKQPDFKTLFESVPGLYLILEPGFKIVAASDAYLSATMTRREEITGRGLFEVFPDNPDDVTADGVSNLCNSLNIVLKKKVAHAMPVQKYDIRRPDGSFEVRYWSPLNKPVLDDNNKVAYIIHRVEDVTEVVKLKKGDIKQAEEIQDINIKLQSEKAGRKKATEKIKENEQMFTNLFYKSPVMKAISEISSGRIIEANDAFAKFTEYEREEMLGKTMIELKLASVGYREGLVDKIKKDGVIRGMEIKITTKNGKLAWVSAGADIIHLNGKDCLLTALIDITSRKESEEKLTRLNLELEEKILIRTEEIYRNEKRFRALVENNYDIISLLDESFKIIYRSPSAIRITGWTNEELLGADGTKNIHPQDMEMARNIVRELMANPGKQIRTLFRNLHKNGSYLWVEGTVTNLLQDEQVKGIVFNFRDVTERVEAAEEISKSENRFRNTLDTMLEGVAIIGFDWRYLYVNNAYAKQATYSKEQLLGYTVMEKFPGVEQTAIFKNIERCFNERIPIHFEDEYTFADNTKKYFELSFQPIPEGVFIQSVDITEKRKAEEKIKTSEFSLSEAQRIANIGSWTIDMKGNKEWSAETYRIYGVMPGDRIPANEDFLKLIHPGSQQAIQQWINDCIAGKEPGELEFRTILPDGNSRYLCGRGELVKDENGNSLYLRGTVQDITERKKIENEIVKSNKRFETISKATNDAVWEWDIITGASWHNEAFLKLFETGQDGKKAEPTTESWVLKIHPGDRERVRSSIKVAIAGTSSVWADEFLFLKADGVYGYFYDRGFIIRDESGKAIRMMGSMMDITELKKAEKQITGEKELSDSIINSLPGVFYLYDENRKFLRWNKNFETVSGYSAAEIGLMHPLDFFDTDEKDLLAASIDKVFETGMADVEAYFYTAKKEKIPYFFTGMASTFEGKNCLIGMGIDITGLKKAEQEKEFERIDKEALINTTEDLIWSVNKELKLVAANKAFINSLFISTGTRFQPGDDLMAEHIFDAGQLLFWKELYQQALRAGKFTKEIFVPEIASRAAFWLEINFNSVHNDNEITGLACYARNITERKKNEEDIQLLNREIVKSEKRFRGLIENSYDIVSISDSAFKPFYRSPAAVRVTGWTDEERDKRGGNDDVHPDDRAVLKTTTMKLTDNPGVSFPVSFRIKHKNGHYRFLDGMMTNMLQNDAIKGIVGNFRDITETRKAEEKIRESERIYRTIASSIPGSVILLIDLDYRYLLIEGDMLEKFGYSKDQLLGNKVQEILTPERYAAVLPDFQRAFRGETFNTESDRGEYHIVTRFVPLKDENNKVYAAMVVVIDVTELKKAEDQIRKEKELSDSIINSLPGIFYLFDAKRNFLRWNKNFETVSGYTTEEIKQISPIDFYEGEGKKLVQENFAKTLKEGEAAFEANFVTKNGEMIPYFFTGRLVNYEEAPCLIGTGIDIGVRKKAEEEVKQTSEQLSRLAVHLQNIREEERKRIGREIHDELGQQLTAIKMDVAWIDKKTAKDDSIKSKLKNIITLLDGSNLSVRKILNELRLGILDNHGLIDALEWQGHQFTANTGIPLLFSSSEMDLNAEETVTNCIFRAFQEALTNITRYADAQQVIASLTFNGADVILTVEDDGKGFDTTLVSNKKSFGILGMKERVASLKGKFELISSPGRGTKIIVTIPY